MDHLHEGDEGQEWRENMNLCRLRYKVLWVDNMYGVDGTLCESWEDMEQGEMALRWPKTPIPKKWETWWWEEINKLFPER